MLKEANVGNPTIPLNQNYVRRAATCGVSVWTVENVRKEKRDMDAAEGKCSFQIPKKNPREKSVQAWMLFIDA